MSKTKPPITSSLELDNALVDDGLESQDLTLRQAIKVVRARFRFILAVACVTLLLVVLISIIFPTKYAATSTIELKQEQNELGGELGEVAGSLTGQSDLKTDLQTASSILQDQEIGVEVLERLHFEDTLTPSPFPFLGAKIPDKAHRLPLQQDSKRREYLLKLFESHLDVEVVPNSRLLQITYSDTNARFAADVTNAIIDQYVKDTLRRRNASTIEATEWMASQLAELGKRVELDQQNLVDFQKKSGFIVIPSAGISSGTGAASGGVGASPGPELHSTLLDRLLALNQTLVQAQAARIVQESIYRVLKTEDPAAIDALASTLLSGPAGSGAGQQANTLSGLVALHAQQTALKQQLAASSQTYGAKNPHVIDLYKQLDFLDNQVKEETERVLASSKSSLDVAQNTEAEAKKEVDSLEHDAGAINDSGVRLAILQQEADSSRALYEDLYTKLEESRLAEETQSSNISVISEALAPDKPSFPKWGLNIGIGAIVGIIFGIIFAFIRESLDDTITNSAEVESITHTPVIGIIPEFERVAGTKNSKAAPVVGVSDQPEGGVMNQRNSEAGEAYRQLRTTIQLSQAGSPPRTLLVTSPLPGDGKSTTCFNLAAGFALLNKRVLLIDADLRKPSLHKQTGVRSTKGLSTLLTSSSDMGSLVLPVPNAKDLFFLGAGPIPPNPAELLTGQALAKLIESASEQYDIVIIDSPPVLLVSDSLIISRSVDGVLVVACAGTSKRTPLLRALRDLRRHQAKILGVVLNKVNSKSSEYYYAYGYYGGRYYGEESNEQKSS
jgi:succinoglycan biosynthesis transport protein ExoP